MAVTTVVVVTDGNGFGGAQVYARSLVTHRPAGVRCDVVTTAEHAAQLEPATRAVGGQLHVVPTTLRRHEAPELQGLLRRLGPDLVQVNLVDPTSMLAAVEAALPVASTVATLHMSGGVPEALGERTRRAYGGLRHLVAVSRDFARLARDELGVAADRVTHVLNGVDPLDRVVPPGGRVPVIGAFGRLTPQKGFDILIEAVALLTRDGVRLRVVIGGEGRERDALTRQAAGLPVRLLGFQRSPRAFLSGVDVFCLPSRVEALPLALLEAVSTGLPAVSSDVGDVREAFDGVVRLVPPDDPPALAEALAALLDGPAARRDMGRRGAAVARSHLTADRMAEQTWAAFLA